MEKLNGDLITYIGRFVSFEDRRNCIRVSKALSKINSIYTHQDWKSLNTSIKIKYDALIKYKPFLNSLYIEIGQECIEYIHEADYMYVANRVKNIQISVTHNIPIIDQLMSIADKNNIYIDLSVKINELNEIIPLFQKYQSVKLNYLNVFSLHDNELKIFCEFNKEVARVREFTIDCPIIDDVSDLKTIDYILYKIYHFKSHNSILKVATTIDCHHIICDNDLSKNLIADFCKCTRMKKLVLQGIDIRDIFFTKELSTAFIKMLVTTNCVLVLCPYTIKDPMIIPLIKFIFKNTNNHILLLSSSDDYDLYINMIMLHTCAYKSRLNLSKPCSIKKSYKDTLADLNDLNPEAHEMWSVLSQLG